MAHKNSVMKGNLSECAEDMKKWVNCKDMSDIKFLIGPDRKVLHAHRILLAARSAVFSTMFVEHGLNTDKEVEVPLVLPDISTDIFMAMLEYIYTNCVTLNMKIAIEVMGIAAEYGLSGLQVLCNEYLKVNLSVNMACDTMQAAVTFGQTKLQEATMDYIENHTQDVFKSKSFHEMSDTALATVLNNNKLLIDEGDVLNHVREWAAVNSVVMRLSACEVAKHVICHVRLPLLSPEELQNVEVENTKDHLIPVDMIAFAWKCHALQAGQKDNPLTTKRNGTLARDCHQLMNIE